MSLPDRTTVLVVGAGPAGLATVLSLLNHGLRDFVIVDALPQGRNLSRSMVCHTVALEALDAIECGDDIVSQGLKAPVWHFQSRSKILFRLLHDSLEPHTRHPYTLVISQNVVERTLETKLTNLGVTIHRPFTVVGLMCNAGSPELTDVTFDNGRVITAKYVIGADGARSAIRAMVGIGFSDPTITKGEDEKPSQMVFADVTLENLNEDDPVPSTTFTRSGFFLIFPFPSSFNECLVSNGQASVSDRIYRIGCSVPLEEEVPRSPSKEYIQKLVDQFGPHSFASNPSVNPASKPTPVKQVVWSSRFYNRASIADTAFIRLGSRGELEEGGIILLVGDAAHIHPPAGGQGMNLSLCDAVALGEAVSKHVRASETKPLSEADTILREFVTTRRAHALEVIKLTKRMAALEAIGYRKWMYWWLPIDTETYLIWFFWFMGQLPFVKRKMVWDLSGLGSR